MVITVVIPLYNKKKSILRTLDSVFKQTCLPQEIIIVNDGSTDGSEKLVEELNNPLIRLFNQTNAGVSAARNSGIDKASGDWIALLDADDEWKPEYLETIKFLFNTYPNCQILATAYEIEDHLENRKKITLNKIPFSGSHGELDNYFEVASCSHPPICSSAVIIEKVAIQKVKGFPLDTKSGEDLLTWARLAINYRIAYSLIPQSIFIQDPEHTYIERPNRIPENPDNVGLNLKELLKDNPSCSEELKKYISHWFIMRSATYLRLNKSKNARIEIFKSLKLNPFQKKAYIFLLISVVPTKSSGVFELFRKLK